MQRLKESAEKAFNYYEAGDWKDSNGNQVKSWKQKMQGVWFKDENNHKDFDDAGIGNCFLIKIFVNSPYGTIPCIYKFYMGPHYYRMYVRFMGCRKCMISDGEE